MNTSEPMKKPSMWRSTQESGHAKAGGKSSAPLLVAFVFIFALTTLYFYSRWGSAKAQLQRVQAELADVRQNPGKAAKEETQALLRRIGQLIVLPQGEEPTVATVNDPERLKVQPFFALAKQGDKVLIYTNAKKAILYDTGNHKIIEVAPVSFGNQADGTP